MQVKSDEGRVEQWCHRFRTRADVLTDKIFVVQTIVFQFERIKWDLIIFSPEKNILLRISTNRKTKISCFFASAKKFEAKRRIDLLNYSMSKSLRWLVEAKRTSRLSLLLSEVQWSNRLLMVGEFGTEQKMITRYRRRRSVEFLRVLFPLRWDRDEEMSLTAMGWTRREHSHGCVRLSEFVSPIRWSTN